MKIIDVRFDSRKAYLRWVNAMCDMPNGKGIRMGVLREEAPTPEGKLTGDQTPANIAIVKCIECGRRFPVTVISQ